MPGPRRVLGAPLTCPEPPRLLGALAPATTRPVWEEARPPPFGLSWGEGAMAQKTQAARPVSSWR